MKSKFAMIALAVVTGAAAVCGGQSGAEDVAAITAEPRFDMLKSERVDVGPVKRLKMWVSVPDGLTTAEVARVMAALVHENTDMHAVSVFVMRDGERPDLYTVGKCDWAPRGDWGRARDGLADPRRETYTVTGDFRARYFSGIPRPTLHGLSARDVAAMASEWREESDKEQTAVFARTPLPDRATIKAAGDKAAETVAKRHKLTPAQVKEIVDAYNSDVLRCVK